MDQIDTNRIAWIAIDWGTSRLRAWAMSAGGTVLGEAGSDRGMAGLAPGDFEPILVALLDPWLTPGRCLPVLACGMVGARQGWCEATYGPVPGPPLLARDCITAPATDPRIDVRIVPGLSQSTPPDVMRGEETQIAGLLASDPGYDAMVCLPGTHTKWARVAGGQVIGFQTVMTGELFALLADHSVLHHSIGTGWDAAAFAGAVVESHGAPHTLTARLFGLRAGSLLQSLDPDAARARLSGLLIGAEIAGVEIPPGPLTIIGAPDLSAAYRTALACLGHTAGLADATALTLAGLGQVFTALAKETS